MQRRAFLHGILTAKATEPLSTTLPQEVNLCFTGGERIRPRHDWQEDVLPVPGHSRVHLALYDRSHRAAFIAGAVHGRGCPKATCGVALPVTYCYVDAHLLTLRLVENLHIDTLYTAHLPTMPGGEISDFFAGSRLTLKAFDEVLLASLQRNPYGQTFAQLIDTIDEASGDCPKDNLFFAILPAKRRMDQLVEWGKVGLVSDQRPLRGVTA